MFEEVERPTIPALTLEGADDVVNTADKLAHAVVHNGKNIVGVMKTQQAAVDLKIVSSNAINTLNSTVTDLINRKSREQPKGKIWERPKMGI